MKASLGGGGGGAKQDEPLRFGVGAAVECLCEEGWMRGEVVAHHCRESDWEVGRYVPYQVKLLNDMKIRVPVDENATMQDRGLCTPRCQVAVGHEEWQHEEDQGRESSPRIEVARSQWRAMVHRAP